LLNRTKRNLQDLADEDLIGLARTGEADAFGVVLDRHSGPAYSLAYRICGSRSKAEDIVQEAFLSLWRSGAGYDITRGSVRSWILAAVHHRAIDALRRDQVHTRRDVSDEGLGERLASADRTEQEVERRDEAQRIRRALLELPEEQRRVIELAYFGGFTHNEISELLALPAGTVKGRMRLGLAKLRLSMSGEPAVP
jgi:RNA polymerase sigma-70 factor (ECF subfamily)